MRYSWIGLGLVASLSWILGCPDQGTMETDDDTYGEDDDAGDDDTGDDDTGDDDTGDDDTGDDDTGDDDTGDDDTGDDDTGDDDTGDDDTGDDDTGDDDDDDTTLSCNPWDPVDVSGAEWVYTSSYTFQFEGEVMEDSGTEEVSYGGTTTFEGETVYQREGSFVGSQVSVNWWGYDSCDGSGSLDHGSYVEEPSMGATVSTINDTPVQYLPLNPDTAIGDTWTTNYTQTVELIGAGINESDDYAVQWDWEVVGTTTVNVPAGTFTAVQIHAEYTSEDQLGVHNGTLDTYWVEGLGLVKWDEQRPLEGGQYILRELQSYSGPLAP